MKTTKKSAGVFLATPMTMRCQCVDSCKKGSVKVPSVATTATRFEI